MVSFLLTTVLWAFLEPQDPDPVQVESAIKSGASFLLKKYEKGLDQDSWNSAQELILLSLSHAKVPTEEPLIQKGLEALEKGKLWYTYRVALTAMALQRIDPLKYQDRIALCAQWLVDFQLSEGDWGYPGIVNAEDPPIPVATYEPSKPERKKDPKNPKDPGKISVRRKEPVPPKLKGDISNTQFAVLGLRACADAGIEIPKTTWEAALRYFYMSVNQDGGWGYYYAGERDKQSYGSMSFAGLTSIAICRHFLGSKDPLKDKIVQAGQLWVGRNFRIDENPFAEKSELVDPKCWQFYYLYSIERAGRILGSDTFGKKNWYAEGAKYLLKHQRPDGSWHTGVKAVDWKQTGDLETADTCFGILFLTKATPLLTATKGAGDK
jgi:hypothetical protein